MNNVLVGCDLMFTVELARQVRARVTAAMGGQCPCEEGRRCPLLPADAGDLIVKREPAEQTG